MADSIVEQVSIQDRDLLLRLSLYFDSFDQKVRQGQGWFIFNAEGGRGNRISTFIEKRLNEHRPGVHSFVISWRDFALSAYVNEVGLPQLEPQSLFPGAAPRLTREVAFARQVTDDVWQRCSSSEMLMLVGLKPAHHHEVEFLDRAIEERYRQRLATILVTPETPQELEAEVDSVDPTLQLWDRLFTRMYETSLVAL
ncbi:MAG: hypothetical protein AB7V46_03885 [Thermomicrobiales bacterium]